VIVRAVVVGETGPQWAERERRSLVPGQARVRVRTSAITGLDRDVIAGRVGFTGTPGHTFVGEVVEADGPSARDIIGRRVIPRGSWGCGICDACAAGLEERCASPRIPGFVGADGAHAEEIVVPVRALAPLDEVITDEAGVLVPVLAGILQTIVRADLPPWTNVLVVGDGGTGLMASTLLAQSGYTVTLNGRHGDRFDVVRRHRVNFVLTADDGESAWRPGRIGPTPMRYPVVVDASGSAEGWQDCLELASPGATVLVLSSMCDGIPRPVERVQEKSLRLIGVREGPVEPAMAILAAGLFDPTEVVRRIDSFDDVLSAYDAADKHTNWLTMLRMVG